VSLPRTDDLHSSIFVLGSSLPLVPHPKRCANVVAPLSNIRALTRNNIWTKLLVSYARAEDSSGHPPCVASEFQSGVGLYHQWGALTAFQSGGLVDFQSGTISDRPLAVASDNMCSHPLPRLPPHAVQQDMVLINES
jgi:hypothetical protein